MAEKWLIFNTGKGEAAFNMGLDEALMHFAERLSAPVLRFYGWLEDAATFGYSQRYREVSTLTNLRPLVRRPTGGGLVKHDFDWTYSLVVPPNHSHYRLKAVDSYQLVHKWVAGALDRVGVKAQLAPCAFNAGPGQCFVGAEKFDVVSKEGKIAGAAQRRSKSGLLIQGSVQIPGNIKREAWEAAMLDEMGDVAWEELKEDGPLLKMANALAREKYSTDGFNQMR